MIAKQQILQIGHALLCSCSVWCRIFFQERRFCTSRL